ncbi:exonuclease V, beta chain with recC and recD: 5' and 3' nuclease, ATPase, recombinase, helicase [Xenorhabdus bovienii str. Jollieti]|uniref:RecBCD enzyme subunit RecB n=1 Tax=Xenorhabdus bovienii (strain SS-2004) TaxID=406818 RepID=D3V588_XENBS|nr:exodeoxyribonuclease V subunit beta [Xenorhabdus bovienii]CBJ82817.1 exonuclease V, beta chain with recC and recD: 5' and 3' nuclease, ATPase, recombinase, helicase [Xenorhabdus bovienii SS-2004]CDH28598.1 exonuclease V, beta chain with recC and recD: 5' and 3' nuclease, ATPase, recombinase, helicase [Xenorhabdus bovienii str. Jollieti]
MSTEILNHKLNPLTLPLHGQRLIEASAGTGKTYTIGLLYLRLLLGLGGDAAFFRPLNVEEILVVTFTEAATDELRGRIRENIHQLRLACIREGTEESDPVYQQLLDQIPDRASAASWLLAAERQMDEAAIYTIHGFCQRMLVHNAFESGVLFDQTLIQDEYPLRKQGCADFWRRHCYPLSLSMATVINQEWSGPEALLKDVSSHLQGDMPYIVNPPDSDETLIGRHEKIISLIDTVKHRWRDVAPDLHDLIANSDVDKRSYSKKHLPNWLNSVSEWAESQTRDYQLPKELDKFSQSRLAEKTKKGETPQHPVFTAIDDLYQQPLTLRDIIISKAIVEIRQSVNQEKLMRGHMGFDDLLTRLDSALQREGGKQLATTIRQRYPVAMIDEFQDTDPQQYRIFQAIYCDQPENEQRENGLMFIGDPKQAIYAFRGADIFTYIRARSQVSAHYTLETNWRSSVPMVQAVNKLFSHTERPFLFSQIPFINVKAAEKNHNLRFLFHHQEQAALQFWLQPGEGVAKGGYEQSMARHCAAQIRDWLLAGQQGQALLQQAEKSQPVTAADITVLVRNRREAAMIRDELNALKIPSVFLSNRDSVFDTPEAKDLLWLLQAVLSPEKERELRSALASSLFGLSAQQIDQLNHDETAWDHLVDEFSGYARLWRSRGVLPMLRAVMVKYQVAENLLAGYDGERRLTDVMHIGELLQETSLQLDSEHAVVRWLAQQISRPDPQSETQQMRLESDKHLVQICTIHKSKGLEYPLVCLPFICSFRKQEQAIYHDRQSFETHFSIFQDDEKKALADEERLAEDLRLLYVALTRSIYHCSVGVAPLIQGNKKKAGNTDLHLSALGYLLQKGQQGDAQLLADSLNELSNDDIQVTLMEETDDVQWCSQNNNDSLLAARKFRRSIQDDWRVTSYSGLQYSSSHSISHAYTSAFGESVDVIVQSIAPKLDIDARGEKQEEPSSQMTPHTFPRGASAGTFLHSILEDLDFSELPEQVWLAEKLTAAGFDENWAPVLQQWIADFVTAELDEQGIQLANVPRHQQQSEMQFYLPVDKLLHSHALSALTRRYDPLSAQCAPLSFHQVKGMLKGFIDLVFCWQGKFYVVDYKSNWLGESSQSYTQEAMAKAMIEHRYDLQYQLYTLALHRYLRHRLVNYDYQQHFGGVIYLFLRGIDKANPGHGVYRYLPSIEFVDELDRLFSAAGEEQGV